MHHRAIDVDRPNIIFSAGDSIREHQQVRIHPLCMCGLLFSIRLICQASPDEHPTTDPIFDALLESIVPRGPDSIDIYTSQLRLSSGHDVEIKLAASVLGLRGDEVTSQPLVRDPSVLGWNGQVFQGLKVGIHQNDTKELSKSLQGHDNPLDVVSEIEGPYAFIHYNEESATVHFQLDPLSRRSLLVHPPDPSHQTSSDRFILCSARNGVAKQFHLPMRTLDGGEGGVIELKHLSVLDNIGTSCLDISPAVSMHKLGNLYPSSPLSHLTPVNTALPDVNPSVSLIQTQVTSFIEYLSASVCRRVENIPNPERGSSRVAILFSGGVDCTLLACLVHRYIPRDEPIDLVNVAFERPSSTTKHRSPRLEAGYNVPDRLSGLEATEELRAAYPEREWRFVEINVPYTECQEHRPKVLDLMYPSTTEMDISLALPLYFASRGIGTVQSSSTDPRSPYHVTAKVYISGLGADEQLAGYSRHRHAYHQNGWRGLIAELQMDVSRLPTRNLSRDDRIISSHARDARFPYLDLAFISYLSSLPVWLKCNLAEDGGDKLLLRLSAAACGVPRTSRRVKRAMQFGTRSAKVGINSKGRKGDMNVEDIDL